MEHRTIILFHRKDEEEHISLTHRTEKKADSRICGEYSDHTALTSLNLGTHDAQSNGAYRLEGLVQSRSV